MTKEPERHDTQIDGLRAIAVSAVLFNHFWQPDSSAGHWGVRLFFVISGFLITRILVENRLNQPDHARGSIALAFYTRRALRIFPAYYFVLFIAVIAGVHGVRGTFLFHALYGSNLLIAINNSWDPWPTSHLWSLSVEEQFYLIWPAFILFLPRKILPFFLTGMIVMSVLFKELYFKFDPQGLAQLVLMPSAIDAMAVGGILSTLVQLFGIKEDKLPNISRILLVLSAVAGALIALTAIGVVKHVPASLRGFMPVVPMGYLVLASSLGIPGIPGKLLNNRLVRYIGKISYGIYLWHFFVIALLFRFVPEFILLSPDPGSLRLLIAGGLTIAIAALSWNCLERPLNKLKHFFPYEKECSSRLTNLSSEVVAGSVATGSGAMIRKGQSEPA